MIGHAMSVVMLGAATIAVIYVGVTGERWPLSFIGVMIMGSLIVGLMVLVGDYLGRDDDD